MTETIDKVGAPRKRGWLFARWLTIAGLLALPWIAMQFTPEVRWTASDFAFMAVLLIGAGLVFELAVWKIRKPLYRAIVALGVLGVVLLVWAEGAVGIFH